MITWDSVILFFRFRYLNSFNVIVCVADLGKMKSELWKVWCGEQAAIAFI